jgi:hypothetical protein
MALQSPLARGSAPKEVIDECVRRTKRNALLFSVPCLIGDVPTLISSFIEPSPGANLNGDLDIKRVCFIARAVLVLVIAASMLVSIQDLRRRVPVFFRQILSMPLDDSPRAQVEGLRDRILVGYTNLTRSLCIITLLTVVLMIPLWWMLALSYWQPVGRLMTAFATYVPEK